MVKNPPSNAGDVGKIPQAVGQLRARALEPVGHS